MLHGQQESRARKQTLLGSLIVYMSVLSDDFATVDVREVLCYHSRPEKAKFGEHASCSLTTLFPLSFDTYHTVPNQIYYNIV